MKVVKKVTFDETLEIFTYPVSKIDEKKNFFKKIKYRIIKKFNLMINING